MGGNTPLIITLGAMIVLFSILSPHFLQLDNIMNIVRSVSISGIVAIGTTIVLISGGIDLSIAAVMALTGLAAAGVLRAEQLPIIPAIVMGFLAALAAGSFIGLINGMIVTKMRINPLITTLAMAMIVRGLAYVGTGGYTLTVPMQEFTVIGRGRLFDVVPYAAILLILTMILAYVFLKRTLAGRYVYSIGGNPVACRLAGINVDRWRVIFYVLGGLFAGFGGFLFSSLIGAAMGNAAVGAELNIIAAVILGGASLTGGEGSVTGTLLGVLILGTLTNGLIMLNVSSFWQMVAQGLVLLIAVLIDALRSGGYR
jgi:ribose transport system permease protein